MADGTTTQMLAEIDRDLADIEKAVSALQQEAAQANYPQQVETTTDRLAEIEGQAGAVTSDDVAAEALAGVYDETQGLQMQIRFLKDRESMLETRLETTEAALLEQQQRNEQLVTQGSQQRMQIQELRSEVSHVQGLLGEEKLQNVRLETLVADLRAVNAGQEKAINGAARDKADLQHRLDVVAAEWAQQAETSRRLQIELDAREQVPQAVSDRFEEGWDKGTAQAVETIAEWLEPIKAAIDAADNQDELARSGFFAIDTIRHLPAIMRTLTGLTDED